MLLLWNIRNYCPMGSTDEKRKFANELCQSLPYHCILLCDVYTNMSYLTYHCNYLKHRIYRLLQVDHMRSENRKSEYSCIWSNAHRKLFIFVYYKNLNYILILHVFLSFLPFCLCWFEVYTNCCCRLH